MIIDLIPFKISKEERFRDDFEKNPIYFRKWVPPAKKEAGEGKF